MLSIPTRWFLSLMVVALVVLAGCVTNAQQGASPTATHTPLPPTLTPSTSIFTPTATDSPTSAPVAPAPLVGAEWSIAFEGDLNQDGQRDVVAYKPAALDAGSSMHNYQEDFPWTISEAVIVQANEHGNPHIQAIITTQGISAEHTPLITAERFGEPGPSALLLGVDPQAEVAISLIPLNTNGEAYAQGVGLYWNEGHLAYRLFAHGQPVPPLDGGPPGSTLPLPTPVTPATPRPSETQSPDETEIVLYWVVGESLQPEHRRIPSTAAIGTATLEALLAGPQHPGLHTAIPTPQEVQDYPGRQPDWGNRVRLLDLTIENGIATANFSQEMRAYGGGSARVAMIRQQITQTLKQFPTVDEVHIAIEGKTEGVLQP